MSNKRPHSPNATSRSNPPDSSRPPETHQTQTLFKSSTIRDRSSDFTAIFSPTQPITTSSTKSLQSHEPFRSASHRIIAWRKPSTQTRISLAPPTSSQQQQKTTYITGCDDDGERYAGNRLERLLNSMQVIGTIVVARWYGGVLLGPVRFTHIETVAREAITLWHKSLGGIESGPDEKRRRTEPRQENIPTPQIIDPISAEEESERRTKLAGSLAERDKSIVVLRNLLTEKQQGKKEGKEQKSSAPISEDVSKAGNEIQSSPEKKGLDYASMPLQRLRQLEKARDATLTWILKEIDKLEELEKKSQA